MTPSEQDQPINDAEFTHLRMHNRKPVLWSARAETGAGAIDCIALNLSLGGAKLRLSAPLPAEQAITLVIARIGSFRARVTWSAKDGEIHSSGIRFTDPPEVVARMLRRALPV